MILTQTQLLSLLPRPRNENEECDSGIRGQTPKELRLTVGNKTNKQKFKRENSLLSHQHILNQYSVNNMNKHYFMVMIPKALAYLDNSHDVYNTCPIQVRKYLLITMMRETINTALFFQLSG